MQNNSPHRKRSSLLDILLGDRAQRAPRHPLRRIRRLVSPREKEYSGRGSRFSETLRKSALLRAWESLLRRLAGTPTAVYGALCLSFGVSTLLFHLADYYIRDEVEVPLFTLGVGIFFALIAIPLFFSQDAISIAAQKNPFTDTVFFEIFCFRRLHAGDAVAGQSKIPAVLIGALLGGLGWLLPFGLVLLCPLGLLFLTLSFSSPEFAFFIALLTLPLYPLFGAYGFYVLLALLLLSLFSFGWKVFLGKRVFRLSGNDLLAALFSLALLFSALPNFGDSTPGFSWQLAVLCFAYLPTSNFILNRRIADSSVFLLIFSASCASVFGLVRFLLDVLSGESALALHPEWESAFFFPSLGQAVGYHRLASTFSSPDLFAVLLAVAVCNTLFCLGDARRENDRLLTALMACALILCGAALILTFTPGVLLTLVLSAVAFRILRSSRLSNLLLLPLALVSLLPALIPDAWRQKIFSSLPFLTDAPIASRRAVMLEDLRRFAASPLFGSGSAPADGTGSFFASLLAYTGVFPLLFLLVLLLLRARQLGRLSHFLSSSSVRLPTLSSSCSLFLMLTLGASVDFFSDVTLVFLFWALFGIGTATLRIARTEANEMRFARFDSVRDAAAVDLLLPG